MDAGAFPYGSVGPNEPSFARRAVHASKRTDRKIQTYVWRLRVPFSASYHHFVVYTIYVEDLCIVH